VSKQNNKKFSSGVNDSGGAPGAAITSANLQIKKILTALMGYSEAKGKLVHENNPKSKLSWHCPF
jgi:hypothetical protein